MISDLAAADHPSYFKPPFNPCGMMRTTQRTVSNVKIDNHYTHLPCSKSNNGKYVSHMHN